ncbi:MAG TPA: Zn-dependent hydrolase [Actinomycetes bacterium]|jgi:allantoate deiminase|nr:Zn-dependent hydrolase [Actinomycetes bacterium]
MAVRDPSSRAGGERRAGLEEETRIEAVPPSPRADASRISEMISQISAIGVDPAGGISRLAFSPEEREAHRLVAGWATDLGLRVDEDPAGNTLVRRLGRDPRRAAIAFGSHLDSVPHGGRFDGVAGVVAMVELMSLLEEGEVTTEHPLLGVAFAGEEGARFGEPCIGSKAVAGLWEGRDLSSVVDAGGTTLAQAMSEVGLEPTRVSEARWDSGAIRAYFELHIEQARILEQEGRQVGLPDVISGSTRLRLVLTGRADHSGGTPMRERADALLAASEVILAVEALVTDPYHRGARGTVGRVDIEPNSLTTIPGRATMTIDIRDLDGDRQRRTAEALVDMALEISRRRRIQLGAFLLADTSPSVLSVWLRGVLREVCTRLGVSHRVMTSGASHDAQILARVAPAAMVLVPSRDGLSHVPEEWTSVADIARGVEVLYDSVLEVDRQLGTQRPGHRDQIPSALLPVSHEGQPAEQGSHHPGGR